MCGTVAPYEDDSSTAKDLVFYGSWVKNGFHSDRSRFAPGSIVLGFEVLANVFCTLRVFFCVRDENVDHDENPPKMETPPRMACRMPCNFSIVRPEESWGKSV